MNKNWTRWVCASILKHCDDIITIDTFIEGMDRQTRDQTSLAEIRIDGPWFNEQNRDYWRLYIELNVLVPTVMDDDDLYLHYRNIGDVNMCFQNCIPVYKYGDGPDDDSSQLGCLQLVIDRYDREQIKTANFGQIDKSVQLQQATVEAHFEMFLDV